MLVIRFWLLVVFVGLLGGGLGRAVARPAVLPGDSLIPYRQGARWGYATPRRRLVIVPQYTYAERFEHGLARVWRGGKCGFIDASGRVVVPIRFDRAGYYRPASPQPRAFYQEGVPGGWAGGRGLVVVMQRDSLARPRQPRPEEELELPPWFDAKWASYPGTDRWGLYDSLGRVVLPLDYAFLARREDGLLAATRVASHFSGSLSEGEFQNSYHSYPIYEQLLFTTRGRLLLRGHGYTSLGAIVGGQLLAHVSRYPRGHWGGGVLVDTATGLATGQQYGPIEWLGAGRGFAAQLFHQAEPNSIPYPSEPPLTDEHHMPGASWRSGAVWLRPNGQPRTPQRYRNLWPAAPSQAIAVLPASDSLPDRAGVLDLTTGAWAVAPRYEEVTYGGHGTYLVRERKRWGLVDQHGRTLVPPRYEGWRAWGNWPAPGLPDLTYTVLVRQAGRWGVLDVRGRELIAPLYEWLEPEAGGYRMVPVPTGRAARAGQGILTKRGRVFRAPVYERIQRCQTVRGQALPYWQAWRNGETQLLSRAGRVLLASPGHCTLGGFYRGRALLKVSDNASQWDSTLAVVELGPAGRAHLRPPGPAVIGAGPVWRDTQGRLVWRREHLPGPGRPPGPYGLVRIDTAAGPEPDYDLLTAADTSRLTSLRYDAIEPQPEAWARIISSYLRVRQGNRLGVLSTTGQVVVPLQYADILWPERPHQVQWTVGETGVFWARPPGGTWQAVGPGGRLLRDTGSAEPPQLPYFYEDGYGLLTRSGEWDVLGYVDAVGNRFFSDTAAPAVSPK